MEHNAVIQEISDATLAIANAMRALPLGGTMTYEALSNLVGFKVTTRTPAYNSARRVVLREGVSIGFNEHNVSFRRRTADEMAEGKHRFNPIRRIAKRGQYEAREALKSNDARVQAKASIASAKYAMLAATKAVSNKDVPSDKI